MGNVVRGCDSTGRGNTGRGNTGTEAVAGAGRVPKTGRPTDDRLHGPPAPASQRKPTRPPTSRTRNSFPVPLHGMCRNITTLRGLEPEATPEEIEAAARQYVRKVSGVQATSERTADAFERAVRVVTVATTELLAHLPPRQQPPPTLPPLRRLSATPARPPRS